MSTLRSTAMFAFLFAAVIASAEGQQPGQDKGKGRPAPARVPWPKDKKVPELPTPDADGFISLFNGKDLTNWEGLDGFWSAMDGAIEGSATKEKSKQTFLVLAASWADPSRFADFELQFKYKYATPTGNSGVQFRSAVIDGPAYRVGGYQADFDTGGQYDGGFYDEAGVAGGRGIMANRGFKTTWDKENKRANESLGLSREELAGTVNKGRLEQHGHHRQGEHRPHRPEWQGAGRVDRRQPEGDPGRRHRPSDARRPHDDHPVQGHEDQAADALKPCTTSARQKRHRVQDGIASATGACSGAGAAR
jgi:hypothetical protein